MQSRGSGVHFSIAEGEKRRRGEVYSTPTTGTERAMSSQQSQGGGFSRLKAGPLGPSALREAEATAALWEAQAPEGDGAHMPAF